MSDRIKEIAERICKDRDAGIDQESTGRILREELKELVEAAENVTCFPESNINPHWRTAFKRLDKALEGFNG